MEMENKEDIIYTVGLLMTYQCNLDCTYCYIANKKNKQMSLEMAKKILEPLLIKEGPMLMIILIGAETLTAFSTIKELVEWAEQGSWKREFSFFGSTNGTLLDAEMKQWFKEHKKNIVLGLSYDGTPRAHHVNRSGSEKDIDIDFFKEMWPEQKIQMTINEETVEDMAEGVIDMLEKGFCLNANVAYEEKEWSERSIREYGRQLLEISEYYCEHPEKFQIYQFKHPLDVYAENIEKNLEQVRQCGAGDGFYVYDIDGKRYPCHMLSPLVLSEEELLKEEAKVTENSSFYDSDCEGCPYVSECATCMGCNFRFRGHKAKRDKTHCRIMKMEIKVFMKHQIKVLMRKPEWSAEDTRTAKAIIELNQWNQRNGGNIG